MRAVPRHPGAWSERAYAGFWRRGFAFAIDSILLLILGVVVTLLVSAMLNGLAALAGAPKERVASVLPIAGWAVGLGLVYLYFAAFESSEAQATLGKRALGVRIGNQDGERLGFVHALLRNVAKLAWGGLVALLVSLAWGIDPWSDDTTRALRQHPAAVFAWVALALVGHLMAGWTRDKQAFHDIITGCYAFRR
jgi:uncharacterized RDD family membrane protein YckC